MLCDALAGAVYRLLDFLPDARIGICRNHLPPILELLQGRREQGIEGPLAVALERCADSTDLSLKLLELTFLFEQDIALGRQDFVDALVVPAAYIANELSEHHGIFDRAGGHLTNLCGCSLDNQARDRGSVMALNCCLERLFLACRCSAAIEHALPGAGISILGEP